MALPKPILLSAAALGLAVSVVLSCGEETTPEEADPTKPLEARPIGDPVSAPIGPDGGSLISADGHLTLEIPPGALASETLIEIQQIEDGDGWAWSLGPDGTVFATPVTARLTFSTAELGESTLATEGSQQTLTVPALVADYVSGSEGVGSVAVEGRPSLDATSLEYAAELAHFSRLRVVKSGNQIYSFPIKVAVGERFTVSALREVEPFSRQEVYLECPTKLPPERVLNTMARRHVVEMSREATAFFEPAGATQVRPESAGYEGFDGDFVCKRPGSWLRVGLRTALERQGAKWPDGCDPPGEAWGGLLLPVLCVGGCAGSDPVDVSAVADGDPSLDLVCAETGISTGGPWVKAIHEGLWRPSAEFYSWYSTISFEGPNGPIGAVTIQHHEGKDETLFSGGIEGQFSRATVGPFGFFVELFSTVGPITAASIESGVKKTPTSPIIVDTLAIPIFDGTAREP